MSLEETVLIISGKTLREAFRLYQLERPPSSNTLYCPYSEMKWYVETVFKQWIRKRIDEVDQVDGVPADQADKALPADQADKALPVDQADRARRVDPYIRFYQECDACRDVFETWLEEACGIFNIAKPPPDAKVLPRRDPYLDAYYM